MFLLSVCLTYWPRKYTTHGDPHVDNSHQVWTWNDHTLPSYSVFVTWPCDLDLLILNSCHSWRFTCPTLPPSMKTLRLSVLELRVITFPIGYHWKCVRGHCACAESWITWPVSRWWKTIIFLESAKLDDIISPRTEMHWYVHAADVHQPEKWGRRSSGGFWGLWRNGLRWQLKQYNVFRIFYLHASNIGIFSIQAFFSEEHFKR